jgi:HEAT repeat protein
VLFDAPDADHDAALAALTPDDPSIGEQLRDYARAEIIRLRDSRSLAAAIPKAGRASRFLAAELEAEALQHARRLVAVLGLLGDQEAMALVAHNLETGDTEAQAAALEALDVLGDRSLVKTLLPLLEEKPRGQAHDDATGGPAVALRLLIEGRSGWLRALAIHATGELGLQALLPELNGLETAPDPRVRESARSALLQLGEKMETLATMSLMERVLLLKEVPLFKDLQPDDLGSIAEIAHERWFADGAALCNEGDHGNELFIIAAGGVRVTRQTDGQEHVLAKRGVGEFIGEMAIIDAVPRFATVRADGETRTLVITSNAFRAILRDRPEVSLAVIHGLSRRLREQT